jgi:hypothetical protein
MENYYGDLLTEKRETKYDLNIGDVLIDKNKEDSSRANEIKLPDLDFSSIDFCKVIAEGNDGIAVRIQVGAKTFFGKYNKRGFSTHYIDLIKQLIASPKPYLKDIIPHNWVTIKNKRFLVSRWMEEDSILGPVKIDNLIGQLAELHNLGFCHLDVAPRNIIRSNGIATLIDFNLVCKVGSVSTTPLPKDVSSVNSMSRKPIRVDDDNIGLIITLKDLSKTHKLYFQNRDINVVGDDYEITEIVNSVEKITVKVDDPFMTVLCCFLFWPSICINLVNNQTVCCQEDVLKDTVVLKKEVKKAPLIQLMRV